MLKQYFKEYEFSKVKTGDTLSTGSYTLTFVEMPMIHWPDNMMTYVAENKIVFSNDAFGQHIASYDIFDDAHGLAKCLDRAKDYYANIVMPYGVQVANKLKQIKGMDLDIDMIAPAQELSGEHIFLNCLRLTRILRHSNLLIKRSLFMKVSGNIHR